MSSLYPGAIVLSLAMLAGCASGPPPQTTADLARAHTMVAAAEQGGAQQYAAADLQSARDKAQQADKLASHDDSRADQLANEAAVDAELASARAQNAQAQHALGELHRSLRTLRNEEERNTSQGVQPLNAVPPANESSPPSDGTPPGAATNPPQ